MADSKKIDVLAYNRDAWDRQVAEGNIWTQPVSHEVIEAARRGTWQLVLTPIKPIPREWYPPIPGCDVLCLASGGGQQGPVLAAAGARVTVLDNSPAQLAQDRLVAEREGLDLVTLQGDMANLHMLADSSFDLIVHPVSNVFAPEVQPVWREAFRVLRAGGVLLAGFNNPDKYIFDLDLAEKGEYRVRFTLPYSDLASLPPAELDAYLEKGWPLEYSHTLEDQIGGQLDAGFLLTGFYEDGYPRDPLAEHMPLFYATRALKPSTGLKRI